MPNIVFSWGHAALLLVFGVLTLILNLLVTKRSQLDVWVESQPRLAGLFKIMRGMGVDPWAIAQGFVLIVKGRLPEYVTQDAEAIRQTYLKPKVAKKTSFPPLGLLVLLVCFGAGALTGCALFGAKGTVWPALGACAPSTDTLFSEVESVLTSSGGSYEDDLLALGKTEGLSFVECAVKSVVEALSARIAARKPGERITPDEGIGVARGKAFLAKIEAAHK